MPLAIPDKVYFKIGEAAEIVGVEPHVLRFWESEFPQIRPVRAGSRQRLYRRRDVETFIEIKRLLYDEQFTIAGARKHLAGQSRDLPLFPTAPETPEEFLAEIKEKLIRIKELLAEKSRD